MSDCYTLIRDDVTNAIRDHFFLFSGVDEVVDAFMKVADIDLIESEAAEGETPDRQKEIAYESIVRITESDSDLMWLIDQQDRPENDAFSF